MARFGIGDMGGFSRGYPGGSSVSPVRNPIGFNWGFAPEWNEEEEYQPEILQWLFGLRGRPGQSPGLNSLGFSGGYQPQLGGLGFSGGLPSQRQLGGIGFGGIQQRAGGARIGRKRQGLTTTGLSGGLIPRLQTGGSGIQPGGPQLSGGGMGLGQSPLLQRGGVGFGRVPKQKWQGSGLF